MFDFENPVDQPEDNPWQDAEFERVVNAPEHQAEAYRRVADCDEMKAAHDKEKQEILEDFHSKAVHRRKERTQIAAYRYALIALACGLLAYACGYYGINWLAWTIGIAAGAFAITSSYGFGRVYEMG